jgi:hypothetical protein
MKFKIVDFGNDDDGFLETVCVIFFPVATIWIIAWWIGGKLLSLLKLKKD